MITNEVELLPKQHSYHNQQHHGEPVIERKEEKLSAAKQKLKQFKEKNKNGVSNPTNGSSAYPQPTNNFVPGQFMNEQIHHQSMSGRSSPVSVSSRLSNSANHRNENSKPSTPPAHQQPSFPNLAPPMLTNDPAIKEQLQLHVQTIGILVAEKAELQSRLGQYQKKADKTQEECDELMGRLKASRQKIVDLERQNSQMQQQFQQHPNGNANNSISNVNHSNQLQIEMQHLNNELNSKNLLINELKALLAECQEKLNVKQDEMQKLSQMTLDLKSHLEIAKMIESNGTNYEDEVLKLRESNASLEATLEKQKSDLLEEHQRLMETYKKQIESLVDQINRMTDEREEAFSKIDRLDYKVAELNRLNGELSTKIVHIEEEKLQQIQQLSAAQQSTPLVDTARVAQLEQKEKEYTSKIDLLENEIKYFKQQIDILLREQQEMNIFLNDKEQSISNLTKLVQNYEADREKFNAILEQGHSDKQTLSRCLKQNNELKEQLTELQDAYVKLTNTNLELATQLESERFKLKHVNETTPPKSEQVIREGLESIASELQAQMDTLDIKQEPREPVLSSDWGDEAESSNDRSNDSSADRNNNETKAITFMDTVKERIEYLEKENKDLNDYISLINQQLADKQEMLDQQTVSKANLDQLKELKNVIKHLEHEKADLSYQLNKLEELHSNNTTALLLAATVNNSNSNNTDNLSNGSLVGEEHLKNMKLLEEKFNKVMLENVDLKEKNQELEHVVQQLQFETETIIDYITMYQMERTKLNEKYKIKDEAIRSLSTQLQVNKLALHEVYNYLNAFTRLNQTSDALKPTSNQDDSDPTENEDQNQQETETEQKKLYLLQQIQKLLNELTFNSSSTLNSVNSVIEAQQQSPSNSKLHKSRLAAAQQTINSLSSNKNHDSEIDPHSIAAFRKETIQCSYCYGDLFVI